MTGFLNGIGVPPVSRLKSHEETGCIPYTPPPSGNMADGSDIPTFPPDADCFAITDYDGGFDPAAFTLNGCTVSQNMVNYLNLTQEIGKYVAAYCTSPPGDDDCPFDFCPNPDIAGMCPTVHQLFLADRISSVQVRWCGSQVSVLCVPVFHFPNFPRSNRLHHRFLHRYVDHHPPKNAH